MDREKIIKNLDKIIFPYQHIITQAMDIAVTQNVTNYPITILHQDNAPLGIPLVQKSFGAESWMINISSLEEFSTKNLIAPERIEQFKDVYKPVNEFICLFAIVENGANFAFIPRVTSN